MSNEELKLVTVRTAIDTNDNPAKPKFVKVLDQGYGIRNVGDVVLHGSKAMCEIPGWKRYESNFLSFLKEQSVSMLVSYERNNNEAKMLQYVQTGVDDWDIKYMVDEFRKSRKCVTSVSKFLGLSKPVIYKALAKKGFSTRMDWASAAPDLIKRINNGERTYKIAEEIGVSEKYLLINIRRYV